MSHNVTLSGIAFSDVSILQSAFDELKKEVAAAGSYEFISSPTTIRGWNGRTAKVDAAIKCPGERYDIGFTRNSAGELVPFLESGFCAAGMSTDREAKDIDGNACRYGHENMALGRLRQRYALIGIERNARMMGSMTRRVTAPDGQIHIDVTSK